MITQPENIAMRKIDILDLGVRSYKKVWDLQKAVSYTHLRAH